MAWGQSQLHENRGNSQGLYSGAREPSEVAVRRGSISNGSRCTSYVAERAMHVTSAILRHTLACTSHHGAMVPGRRAIREVKPQARHNNHSKTNGITCSSKVASLPRPLQLFFRQLPGCSSARKHNVPDIDQLLKGYVHTGRASIGLCSGQLPPRCNAGRGMFRQRLHMK